MPLVSHHNSSQVALGLPSAAPVLEFICLFTHDLKRKQKRWQDGRLKFHTFNKRIMVYDERGNFIGDMHWREDFDFGEGEEINLERGGVIVQVAECVGSKDQDLTELLDKRSREVEQRHARSSAVANSPLPPPRPPSIPQQQHPHHQFKQRHLVDVFNTPRGPQGRAIIPTTSPYEERIAAQASSPQDEIQRPSKRRKRDLSPPSKSGYAQNLFGATLTLSSWSASAPVRSQPARTSTDPSPDPEQPPGLNHAATGPRPPRRRPSAVVDLTGNLSVSPVDPFCTTTSNPNTERGEGSRRGKPTSLGSHPIKDSANIPTTSNHLSKSKSKAKALESVVPERNSQKTEASTSVTVACQPETRRPIATGISIDNASIDARGPFTEDLNDRHESATPKELSACNAEVDTPEEPKAKLRIKARQKRGLLMVANRAASKKAPRQSNTPETNPSMFPGDLSADHGLPGYPQPTGHPGDLLTGDSPIEGGCKVATDAKLSENEIHGVEMDEPQSLAEDLICPELPEPTDPESIESLDKPMIQPEEAWEQPKQPRPGTRRETEAKNSHSGPRLASLGRRSVKSKEIIGSFNGRQARHFRTTSDAAPALLEGPSIPLTNGTEVATTACETADSAEAAPQPAQPARLSNPATRGRKTARKSDAAGAVPQSVVPANPDLAPAKSGGRPGGKSGGPDTPGEPVVNLPGFSKANEGPWSKEAYDLLGCARPS